MEDRMGKTKATRKNEKSIPRDHVTEDGVSLSRGEMNVTSWLKMKMSRGKMNMNLTGAGRYGVDFLPAYA